MVRGFRERKEEEKDRGEGVGRTPRSIRKSATQNWVWSGEKRPRVLGFIPGRFVAFWVRVAPF